MKKAIIICLAAAVFTLACSNPFEKDDPEPVTYPYLFTNTSSYAVTVRPNGQGSWASFVLAAGASKTVSIPETSILFIYDQAGLILCSTSVPGRIKFYNKTLLMIRNQMTSDLDLVNWKGYYFGEDHVWDAVLGQYVDGLRPGSAYVNEVSAGSGYIFFWFAAEGPQYRTVSLVTLAAEEQKTWNFPESVDTQKSS